MRNLNFAKGHGTGNDFVILVDRSNLAPIDADDVRWLCDRHVGLGGDGVLRAVWAGHLDDWSGEGEMWFMDYRNADGSVAEMCGNGLRVFARYLVEEGLVPNEPFPVATRAGVKWCQPHQDGSVTVDLGVVRLADQVEVTLDGQSWAAQGVDVGNPHAVVVLPVGTELSALPVHLPPSWQPAEAFPDGVNVEFVVVQDDDSLAMRVHERGSGETLSCGTGIVAAVAAATSSRGEPVSVRVPGGRASVVLTEGQALLTGPAVIVARGQTVLPDLG